MTAAARQKRYREKHRPKYNLRQKLNMRKYRAEQRIKRIEEAGR